MSNQRVVVLTDEEIEETLLELGKRNVCTSLADCRICTATVGAEAKLRAALGHPGGITDEQVGAAINELSGHDAGSGQSWTEVRHALEAAFFSVNRGSSRTVGQVNG